MKAILGGLTKLTERDICEQSYQSAASFHVFWLPMLCSMPKSDKNWNPRHICQAAY